MVGRVELPIDRDRRTTVDPIHPARHDDPFLIGVAPQNREAFTAEMAEVGRIADDDVILVTSDELLPLLRRRVLPVRPESGTGAGCHVEILTEQLAEPPLVGRRRIAVSHRCEGATSKIADKARRIISGGQASRSTPDGAGQ
jgi:hypothetical protein